MPRQGRKHLCSLPFLFLTFLLVASTQGQDDIILRSNFTQGFIFGAGSSAYQYEGGVREGGRGPTIWDTFAHKYPEKISDGSNGDVAIDSYHRYKEDVMLLKNMNMDSYKFSICWSRILPNGTLSGGINREGIKYYNNLINYIIQNGLQPFVILFHFNIPQALEDAYGGFLSRNIIKDFSDYAEICFREFGDRVKLWIPINEPYEFSKDGYASGRIAPGRCSSWVNNCPHGDSGIEPYVAGHNMLLAHATAVKLYREKYNKGPNKGLVGVTMLCFWFVPLDPTKSSSDAAARARDFMYGWFMDALTEGDYPFIMRALVGNRLPKFTKEESEMIKGSFDFVGINYYTSKYVFSLPFSTNENIKPTYQSDSFTNITEFRNGKAIGPMAGSSWLCVYPQGIEDLLLYMKNKYNNPVIYVTENGVDEVNSADLPLVEALQDDMRIEYHRKHLLHVREAMRKGVDVRGYLVWSLLDNFEWHEGYTVRFGLNYVDYEDGLRRYPKKSALWFSNILEEKDKTTTLKACKLGFPCLAQKTETLSPE